MCVSSLSTASSLQPLDSCSRGGCDVGPIRKRVQVKHCRTPSVEGNVGGQYPDYVQNKPGLGLFLVRRTLVTAVALHVNWECHNHKYFA